MGDNGLLNLTTEGQEAFSLLDSRSSDEVSEMLGELGESDRVRLIDAMQTIESILDHSFKYADPFYLRHHEAGDMGWIIHQHGLLYCNQEYGWDESFEALVAQICADFINNYRSPKRALLGRGDAGRAGRLGLLCQGQ